MTKYSKVQSVKSNARRAARAMGIDPELVTPCTGGFHFPLPAEGSTPGSQKPSAADGKPAEPARWFKTFQAALDAARAQARRSGLKASTFVVVVSFVSGRPEYGFIPANIKTAYAEVTGPVKPPAKEPKAKPAQTKRKAASKPGEGQSKLGTVLALILRPGGATMPEIEEATGWLPHTARARISGLVEKHKLDIRRERLLGVTTYKATQKKAA